MKEEFKFTDPSGQEIYYCKWTGNAKPKAGVQIVHGMAEHIARYDNFAAYLNSIGIVVYGNDHRGHGQTAGSLENTGYLADKDGWEKVTDNVLQLTEIIKKENQGIPVFLFGHSLGSLIARNYIIKYPAAVDGVILSGTSYNPSLLLMFGKFVANIQKLCAGSKHRSKLLDTLSFGSFNSKFKPNRTKFDWLSRDEVEVDKYVNDSYCGFICTTSFYSDMFTGILKIQSKSFISKTPAMFPVFIFSGAMDAVGAFVKGVMKTFELYRKFGLKNIEIKIYKDARHEMLNETNREEVYKDVSDWINKQLAG